MRCWRCGSDAIRDGACTECLIRQPGRAAGQAIVEMALILPLLLFLLLGTLEAGMLVAQKARQDGATLEAARWAAAHPDEPATGGADAVGLGDCYVESDEDPDLGLITIHARCHYHPIALRGMWEGLPISSEASAAVPAGRWAPEPSASPSAAPSASAAP